MKRWMKVGLVSALFAVPAFAAAGAVAVNSWGPCPLCWFHHIVG